MVSSQYKQGVNKQYETSTLTFYQRLLRLRRELLALHNGSFRFVKECPADVLAYVRGDGAKQLLVAINFGSQRRDLDVSGLASEIETLASTVWQTHEGTHITLQPHESVLLRLR